MMGCLYKVKKPQVAASDQKCAVCIPVYKSELDDTEILSFRRCLKILHRHPIILFTHRGLNCTVYNDIAREHDIELRYTYFSKDYFDGISGYNSLLLSPIFYGRFKEYEYILIYQLDAYVFTDQLDSWCNKGYDYVGAPWLQDFELSDSKSPFLGVGNGGFSLRRIGYFSKIFKSRRPVFKYHFGSTIRENVFKILSVFGYKNTLKYHAGHYNGNEDHFFCQVLNDTDFAPRVPTPIEALEFAFEVQPSRMFEIVSHRLPFGCHAFEKYEYDNFWKNFMT